MLCRAATAATTPHPHAHLQVPPPCRPASAAQQQPDQQCAAEPTHTGTPASSSTSSSSQTRTHGHAASNCGITTTAKAIRLRNRPTVLRKYARCATTQYPSPLTRACGSDSSQPGVMPCAFSTYAHSSRTCTHSTAQYNTWVGCARMHRADMHMNTHTHTHHAAVGWCTDGANWNKCKA